ncbi:unnamed protein product [Zymoseptoria tritici ST99CH_3D1]|nr:unnamed protein product [Zymoseptoria tritici ST99CH_3D1]
MLPFSLSRSRDALLSLALGISFFLCILWILNYFSIDLPSTYLASSIQGPSLTSLTLQKVLQDAHPIFGTSSSKPSELSTATWMKAYPDSTRLVHMNLPGTHDSATWNYTQVLQDELKYSSKLGGFSPSNSENYRCQTKSIADSLGAGMRVFDLRYAWDITRTSLVFWHGDALQSETATVADVLFGFYHWLDLHPSEAVILSFQHEHKNPDAGTQMALFEILTSPAAKKYLVQARGTLGNLGEARGKITLFRRFDLDLLPDEYEESIPGLHFSPKKWTVNSPNIKLPYNPLDPTEFAYIQDYYHPTTPLQSGLSVPIASKYKALTANLLRATTTHPDELFWSFASSTKTDDEPPITPRMMASGDGKTGGVNAGLKGWLKTVKGKRVGIVLVDFWEAEEGLVEEFLGLTKP